MSNYSHSTPAVAQHLGKFIGHIYCFNSLDGLLDAIWHSNEIFRKFPALGRKERNGQMEIVAYIRTVLLYLLAGLAEIGGGWLVWQWLREGRALYVGLLGGLILFTYGVIPTLQAEPAFGRVYAAYGGIFIVLSILWGRLVDGWQPDRFDLVGAAVALAGVAIIIWGRRWF